MRSQELDWLTRLICRISPSWGARRITGIARLETATRLYDAIKSTQYRPRRGGNWSGDAAVDNSKGRLREYGRWLDENHDLATGILDDLVTNIVGSGVGVEPLVKLRNGAPADMNQQLRDLWAQFWERPEVTGTLPGPELERLICRSWLRDGEVFIQHVTRSAAPFASGVPYTLEPLESDFVPFDLFNMDDGVTHGIRKNAWGQPLAYYVYKQHPGDIKNTRLTLEYKTIPAENMLHIKFSRRLHQTRGVSVFHSVLTRLDDIKDIEESERIANRIAAAFCAFIKKNNEFTDVSASVDTTTGERNFEMAPGMIFDQLQPGEDVGIIDPKRPNSNLTEYLQEQIRRVSAGVGSRYSSTAKNYNGTYSAQRQELVEGSAHYRRMFSYLVPQFYRPVYRRFIDAARLSGLLAVPGNVDLTTIYAAEFRPPSLPWIDPLKEMNAHAVAVAQGFKSRPQVIRDLGGDPREVDAQLAADTFDVRPESDISPDDESMSDESADDNQEQDVENAA